MVVDPLYKYKDTKWYFWDECETLWKKAHLTHRKRVTQSNVVTDWVKLERGEKD